MNKEIIIEGRKFVIKELTYKEGSQAKLDKDKPSEENNSEWISICLEEPKLTPEEVLKLPYRVVPQLLNECNKINLPETQYFTNSQTK